MSRSRDLSVIMSLHELELAERISDKIMCVKGDKVDRFGTPEEVFTPGYISGLYGMTMGSYDERTGDLELGSIKKDPEVFVIAGNGSGAPLFRKLQREGIPFAVGILTVLLQRRWPRKWYQRELFVGSDRKTYAGQRA